MGSETCLKSSGKWCSLSFRSKKSYLGAGFECPPGLLRKPEVFSRFPRSSRAFWVLVGLKQTLNDKVMTVLVNTGPLYGPPWKNFSFPMIHSGAPPGNFFSSLVEILFPHIYWPMPGMPPYYWLSHTYFTPCHTAKTRRIRLIVPLFS